MAGRDLSRTATGHIDYTLAFAVSEFFDLRPTVGSAYDGAGGDDEDIAEAVVFDLVHSGG